MRELINKARETALSLKDIAYAEEFVEAGEPGLAFEQIVVQLYEFSIPINAELYEAAVQCGTLLKIPADEYSFLKELIK